MEETTTPLDELVATEVRAELGRQNMSKAELARQLGVTWIWINRRLTGEVEFTITELQAVAGVLDVPVMQLLEQKHLELDRRLEPVEPKVPRPRGKAAEQAPAEQPAAGKQLEI